MAKKEGFFKIIVKIVNKIILFLIFKKISKRKENKVWITTGFYL